VWLWGPIWISRPKKPARGPGGGPICQIDSENNWPVRPLMQLDVTHLRPKCYMAALGRNFPVNFGCQGGCQFPRRTPSCLAAAKYKEKARKKQRGGRHRYGEAEGARVRAYAQQREAEGREGEGEAEGPVLQHCPGAPPIILKGGLVRGRPGGTLAAHGLSFSIINKSPGITADTHLVRGFLDF